MVIHMVYIWIETDSKGNKKNFFLQFFVEDTRYQIDKSMATEIFSTYDYKQADPSTVEPKGGWSPATDSVFQLNRSDPILVQSLAKPGELVYWLRFSEHSPDISVSTQLIQEFQEACNLEPTNLKELKYGRTKIKYYRISPKKMACVRFD